MNVTILGGSGFIGSNLCERMLENPITNLTLLSRHIPNSYRETSRYRLIKGDILDSESLSLSLKNSDVVVHLISSTVPATAESNPIYDIQTNLVASVNLFSLLPEYGVKRIIYVSSGGTVYGNPTYLPVDELHPLYPVGSYGIVKVAIESYLRCYSAKHSYSYAIVRPSNPYGPRQRTDGLQGVIATFIDRIQAGQELQVWGDGTAVRDYIYISDLTSFIEKLIFAEGATGCYNVGLGTGYSLNEIIRIAERVIGKKALVRHLPAKSGAVDSVYLDISKANTVANWRPTVSIEEGISMLYGWTTSRASPRPPQSRAS